MEDTKGLPTSAVVSSPELPLDTPSKRGRVQLKAPQIIKASEWMKANDEFVVSAPDNKLAGELEHVLGTRVTENNVTMLREATGLRQRTAATAADLKLQVLAIAVRLLLRNQQGSEHLPAVIDNIDGMAKKITEIFAIEDDA